MRTTTAALPAALPAALLTLLLAAPAAAQETTTLPARTVSLSGAPAPLFAVGKEEGASHEILSNVQAVAFDKDNNLYVLDAGNFRVLVFDARGRFVRQIGKQGQGPGEITFAMGLALTADGNVVVADMGRGGFSLFRPDGSYDRHVTFGEGGGFGGTGIGGGGGGIQASARGGVVGRVMPIMRPPAGGTPEIPRQAFIRHHPLTDGGSVTTLHTFDLPAPRIDSQGSGGTTRMRITMAPPAFAPQVSFGVLPDGGIALSNTAEYAVQVTDANGRTTRVIRRNESPRRVTRADQEAAREQRRRQLSGRGGGGGVSITSTGGQPSFGMGGARGALSKEQIEEQIRSMEFADVVPLVLGITTDPTGRIWIERTPARIGSGPGPIDLVTASGRYIGTVTGTARPAAVNGDGTRAAFIERDDLDVERVVVRSIPAAWK